MPEGGILTQPVSGRDALLVFLAALVMLLPFLGTADVTTKAEGRPALVARDILATGKLRPPTLFGDVYLDKPPLYHGLVALSFLALGRDDEFSARLPSALAAAVTAMVVFMIAAGWRGRAAGFAGAALFLLNRRVFGDARSSELEMLLAMFVTIMNLGILRAMIRGRSLGAFATAAFGAAGAALTKGPALPLIFAALTVAVAAFARRADRRDALYAFGAVLVGAAIAAAAYWGPMLDDYGKLLFDRLVFANVTHAQNPFFYVYAYPGEAWPAVALLPAAALRARREAGLGRILASIFVATFVIFSLKSNKQPHYLLPVDPILAVLLGAELVRQVGERKTVWLRAAAIGLFLAGPVIAYMTDHDGGRRHPSLWALALIPMLASAFAWVALRRPDGRPTRVLAPLFLAAWSVLVLAESIRPSLLEDVYSARAPMTVFAAASAGRPLASFAIKPSFLYYLPRRDVRLLATAADARAFFGAHPDGLLISEAADRRLKDPALGRWRVVESYTTANARYDWRLIGPE